jgi:hypothetical protein
MTGCIQERESVLEEAHAAVADRNAHRAAAGYWILDQGSLVVGIRCDVGRVSDPVGCKTFFVV